MYTTELYVLYHNDMCMIFNKEIYINFDNIHYSYYDHHYHLANFLLYFLWLNYYYIVLTNVLSMVILVVIVGVEGKDCWFNLSHIWMNSGFDNLPCMSVCDIWYWWKLPLSYLWPVHSYSKYLEDKHDITLSLL